MKLQSLMEVFFFFFFWETNGGSFKSYKNPVERRGYSIDIDKVNDFLLFGYVKKWKENGGKN